MTDSAKIVQKVIYLSLERFQTRFNVRHLISGTVEAAQFEENRITSGRVHSDKGRNQDALKRRDLDL